jgi:hypothetical protein
MYGITPQHLGPEHEIPKPAMKATSRKERRKEKRNIKNWRGKA